MHAAQNGAVDGIIEKVRSKGRHGTTNSVDDKEAVQVSKGDIGEFQGTLIVNGGEMGIHRG
jgi:hypothetical protein